MKTQLRLFTSVLTAAFIATLITTTAAGQVFEKPKIYKTPIVIPMPDLVIMDLFEGDSPTSVSVQIGNIGSGNAGPFHVTISMKKNGSTTKTHVHKLVAGLKTKSDLLLNIDVGQPIAGLEIGIFVDSRNQVKEPNETNCGMMFPDGGVGGSMPCKGF